MVRIIALLLYVLFIPWAGMAQDDERRIDLTPFVISADDDLDVAEFMEHVMTDSSFYQAFINLKYIPHEFHSSLLVKNKGEAQKAKQNRKAVQLLVDQKRVVKVTDEQETGKLYKRNGEHKYLTAEMYDEIFFPESPEPVSPRIDRMEQQEIKGSKIDKYKSQLKKMMFNPGQEILSVPFIGDKMDIFSEDMAKYYDFSIHSAYSKDSVYCYVFSVEAKPEFHANKTVIKKMLSYMDKANMQVLSREYVLRDRNAFFQFDIWMQVENKLQSGRLLPARIKYKGNWDIPFKQAEIIDFDIRCWDYDLSVF